MACWSQVWPYMLEPLLCYPGIGVHFQPGQPAFPLTEQLAPAVSISVKVDPGGTCFINMGTYYKRVQSRSQRLQLVRYSASNPPFFSHLHWVWMFQSDFSADDISSYYVSPLSSFFLLCRCPHKRNSHPATDQGRGSSATVVAPEPAVHVSGS